MWDYRLTVGQLKEILASGNDSQRIWLMAKIMRDARYTDVWKFMSLKDFLTHREHLMPKLGRHRGFWQFLYSRWIKYGIISDVGNSDSLAA